MEETLPPSELIQRIGQWASNHSSNLKDNINTIEVDQKFSQICDDVEEGINENEEEENPALEGHFLTEQATLDVTIIDNCICQCHQDQNMTLELNLPFSCSKCSQQFCCKCQFLVHRDFHRGERKYVCQVCDKSYYYKSDLVRHEPVHSAVKPHMCKVCGRSFNQVGHLMTHRLVHTGEKPFSCDICHKPFNRKSNLRKHTMTHTGERPFLCLVCGSRFSRKGDLRRHTMLHTGERPYKCLLCDKTFSQKPHLLSHQSVHTGERQYKCLECNKSFNRKANLIKHQLAKCPALSLKHNSSSELKFNELGSSSFFSHFNNLKSDLIDSEDQETFYDPSELKPVTYVNGVNDHFPDLPGNASIKLPKEASVSLLRARLSNPIVNIKNNTVPSRLSDTIIPIVSESIETESDVMVTKRITESSS